MPHRPSGMPHPIFAAYSLAVFLARQVGCALLLVAAIPSLLVGCHARDRVIATWQLDGSPPQLDGPGTDAASGPFGAVRIISGLLDPGDALQDPTLSPDELEMFFASDKAGTFDVWRSTRTALDQPWSRGVVVDELSTPAREVEPELSEDMLTIYISRDIGENFQLFVSQRPTRLSPWGPAQVINLGQVSTDHGPTIDRQGLTLIFSSSRPGPDFDLYQARRPNQTAEWAAPVPIGELNSEWQDWDPRLFRNGLALAFGSRRAGDNSTTDLFQSARPTLAAPFGAVMAMVELNSPAAEGDPWLSNDGRHVVFASEREGFSQLYEAWR